MTGRLFLMHAAVTLTLLPQPRGMERSLVLVSPDQNPPVTTFRSSVDVVSVSAVVRDRKGRFVGNLERKDFIVTESGRSRPILDFRAQSDGPVKLALLVDISGSMRVGSKSVDARQAARHIFGALRPGDEAAIFSFDTGLDRVTPFTSDPTTLEAALDKVQSPFGQTSLYDAVAQTARTVAAEGPGKGRVPQRSAVVVLTDGIDTRSRLTSEQVATISSSIDIPVYIVALMATIDDPREGGTALQEIAGPLPTLARWTGGEMFMASAPAHASVAARRIVDELRHQYVIAFEASTREGWRALEVRARDRALTVRARAGYSSGNGGVSSLSQEVVSTTGRNE
jgi:Ca-activated chloride channel homolog